MPQTEMTAASNAQAERRGARATLTRAVAAIRRLSRRVGQAEARAILSGFYYVALGTVALVMGRRRRLLLYASGESAAWRPLQERAPRAHCGKQY